MQLLVPIVLYAWLPAVLVIFRDLKGHRGLSAVFVAAWLFLPSTALQFRGMPDYTKVSATSLGVLAAIFLYEPARLAKYRFHWLDLFIATYCLAPIASALSNDLGLWGGLSNSLNFTLVWGVPYFLGRLYFDRFDKVRTLAKAIYIGGLVYVPFCLVEMRMSPQFYNWVYGMRPKTTLHARRYGGWRPTVFLDTGLELGMWMTAASLLGFALWYSGALKRLWGMSTAPLLFVLMVTTVLCKSTGSLLLLIGGLGMMLVMRWTRSPWWVAFLVAVPLLYLPVRSCGLNDGKALVAVVKDVFGGQRAHSLDFRFHNENMLAARAWQQPLFGWGGWGRERVFDEYGEDQTVVDGMWIILFGKFGLLSMVSFYAAFLLAPTAGVLRFGRPSWRYSDVAPLVALCLLMLLYTVDCLLNAMDNAIYALSLGAITTVLLVPTRRLVGEGQTLVEGVDEATPRLPTRQLWPPTRWRGSEVGSRVE
jgi:hypothetical protein